MNWPHSLTWRESKNRGWETHYSLVQCHSFLLQALRGPLSVLLLFFLCLFFFSFSLISFVCRPHHLSLSVFSAIIRIKISVFSLCSNSCSWQGPLLSSGTIFRRKSFAFLACFSQKDNLMVNVCLFDMKDERNE